MATQRTFWECSFCKTLFDDEAQAAECETHHAALSHLQVIDCDNVNADADDLFPEKILLRSEQCDDLVAEYKLKRQGTTAEFYQSDEKWCQIECEGGH